MNKPDKTLPTVFLSGLLMLAMPQSVLGNDSNWHLGLEVAAIEGEVSDSNRTAGAELGYQFSKGISFELATRSVISGEDSGHLTSALVTWRSQPEKLYYKISAGMTISSGDLFENSSASIGLGIGYATDSPWSFELDAIRLSDDVNAISLTTLYQF